MNSLADKYKDNKIHSVFLYTHEAHPGEIYPHLTSMEQKFQHAKDIGNILGVERSILVDALDGACHRAYGSMPNMTWIFNQGGVPVYKSNWTDVTSVDLALDYLISVEDRKREGIKLAPFLVERLDFRVQDADAFRKGLERNGPKAVDEFYKAFE